MAFCCLRTERHALLEPAAIAKARSTVRNTSRNPFHCRTRFYAHFLCTQWDTWYC